MNTRKRSLLEETYERILNVGFCVVPYEDISDIISPDPMVYGTAKDERILSFDGVEALFRSQYEQIGNMKPAYERKRIALRISNGGNNACIIEEITFTLSSEEEIHTIFMRATCVMEYLDNQWKLTHWHTSTPVDTENDPWHMEEWKRENEKLQKLVDEQTADLQGKNRELEIEAAIERVRARTMAMHHTEELKEVIQVLFDQFVGLKIHVDHAGFILDYKEREDMHIWLADHQQGVPSEITIPYFDSPHWNSYREAKAKQQSFFANLLPFEVKNKFYQDLFELIPELTEEAQQAIFSKPALAISTVLLDNVGLYIERYSMTPYTAEDNKILMRFGKVFQQTYTRFLDLQKAEAQAREAEIQLALERVRAKTMAMKTQSDLLDIIELFGEQLNAVGIRFDNVTFIEGPITKKRDWDLWSYAPEAENTTDKILIPYIKTPYFTKTAQAVKEYQKTGQPIQVKTFTKKEKNEFLDHYWKHAPAVSDEFVNYVNGTPGSIIVDAFLEEITVSLVKWNAEPYTVEELEIFERFAKEFRQTYIRFLDIKKAEEQARQAQINLAVERVRARALAMFKSEEILEVVHKLKEEIMGLDIPNVTAATIHLKEPDGRYRAWDLTSINEEGNDLEISLDIRWHREDTHPDFFMREVWDRTEDYFVVIQGGDRYKHTVEWLHQNGHSEHAEEFEEFLESSQLEKAYHPTVPLNNGRMCIDMLEPPDPEVESILKKMAGAFDLAYKRFEDLQKAEAQTREAKIETALEKVRSRTMGMQRSDELAEVANVLFTEMNDLVQNLWTCGFVLCEKGREEDEWWLSLEDGFSRGFYLPNVNDYAHATLYEGWLEGHSFRTVQLDGDKLQEHYDWLMEIPVAKNIFDDMEAAGMERPEWQKLHAAYFSKGYLVIITREPCPEEEVFKRFAKVFDQTYTRFLDLKKAEAQARESQIETALEKVRSRTMAMQHSDELIETSELMFEQIKNLDIDLWSCGFSLWYDDDSYFMGYNTGPDGKMGDPLKIPLTEDEFFTTIRDAKRRGDDFLVFESDGESLEETYSYMDTLPVVGEFMRGIVAAGAELPKYQVTHCGFFSHGHLMFIALEHNPEAIDIFKRFTKVFDQTYTRFLDLQKAEEQAREAQIEAALERVRSRAMAMHNSQELKEVALELRKQMGLLGQKDLEVCAIHLYGDGEDSFESWSAMKAPDSETEIVQTQANFPKKGIRIVDELMRHYNSESRDYVLVNEGEKIEEWFMVMENNAPELHASIMHAIGNASVNKLKANWSVADFSGGALVMVTYGDPDASSRNLLRRSANVFEQAYIRFLDLQKAEEQAREAKIEMSLEKIRSRTMGMQNSKELAEVIAQINAEITNLGIRSDNTTLITDIKLNEKSGSYCTWFSIPGKTYSNKFLLPKMRHPLYERTKEAYQKKIEFFTLSFTKKEKNRYLNFAFAESDLKFLPEERKEFLLNTPGLSQSVVLHKNSGLALQRFSNEAFSEEENAIAIRFGRVFEQTYTRFLDLQKAEAQAIEATKQASLDRVRGEIASMRSAKDLEIITPLIWNELTTLGIPFIRCGVFIIHEEDEQVEVYLSKPDGTSLAVMHLPFDSSELAIQTVDAWRKSSVYTQHWTREEFLDWGRSMMKQGQISDLETYQAAEEEPESLNLHFIPFNQGMLYVGTTESLSNEEIDLAVSLSEAFSIAYARYEDFIKLEKAKAGIEEALAELKATQSQLVQQEKLASLGQLTAGIAHEIKNPLNFVNNFSEVSEEMISELIEALGKGDIDESLALSKDIGANLKKIHEHGSRADGIVKSMLQHSRGGDGKMEPSPLNPIIKEYVNLAFHGMRAGKDPINVDIDLQLDESVGEVPLIAEDFSRVILNVCNNAFDAMREKLGKDLTGFENLSGLEGYHPKLTVRTKSENGTITIEIEDNGPGIPDEIKDKILQPFFTTKKGTQGTGLGLSITNDIIKAHGGKLSVNSTSGSGSTFIITLKP